MSEKDIKILPTAKAVKWLEDNFGMASYIVNTEGKGEWEVYWWLDTVVLCVAGETFDKAVTSAKNCTDNWDGGNDGLTNYCKWKKEDLLKNIMAEKQLNKGE